MKCDTCKNKKGYTLGIDECGAGGWFPYCSKGHWEGGQYPDEGEYNQIQKGKDPWKDCKDYAKKQSESR